MSTRLIPLIVLTAGLGLILSCGTYETAETGSMSARLVFPEAVEVDIQPLAASADCGAINTILIYAEKSGLVAASAAFACTLRSGTLDGIPAGSQYRARVEAVKDSMIVFRGNQPAVRILTGQTTPAGEIPMIRTKPGTCVFTSFDVPVTAAVTGLALGDLDGDSDLDAVLARAGIENRIVLNNGSGYMTSVNRYVGSDALSAAVWDLDGINGNDIVFVNIGPNEIWFQQVTSGTFSVSGPGLGTGDSYSVALGDFNDDEFHDIVVGNDGANLVYANDGSGVFSTPTTLNITGKTTGLAVEDLDGDGNLDIVEVNDGVSGYVHFGNGAGGFAAPLAVPALAAIKVAAGDLDSDGDVDLAVSEAGGTQVLFNDGAGSFLSTVTISNLSGTSIALGDLDGDGDVDIVEGISDEPDRVWFNEGSGTFIDSGMRLGEAGDGTNDLALGDLDGDGDLDLVVVYDAVPPRRWMNRTTDGSATGKLYFVASDGIHGSEIWSLDGGTAARVTSLDNVNLSSSDDPPTVLGNDLVMRAWDVSASDYEPWVLHGETGEVEKLDLVSDGSSNPQEFAIYSDRLFTSAHSGTGWALWTTDGSFSYVINEFNTYLSYQDERSVQDIFLFDDALFFVVDDGVSDRDLHYYYETQMTAGWVKVDINSSGPFDIYSYSKQAVAVSGSRLYMAAQESWIDQGYQELYATSDPSTYASLVRDIFPSGYPTELHPESLVFFQGDLYFSANAMSATAMTTDWGLWIYDGAQAPYAVTMPAGLETENNTPLVVHNEKLFFVGLRKLPPSGPTTYDPDRQIWSYDGASTFDSFHPNLSGDSAPTNLTVFGDRLYFRADVEGPEREPWWYDDTTGVGERININPTGSSQSGPMTPWVRLIPD